MQNAPAPPNGEAHSQNPAPVSFQELAERQNQLAGQQDEIQRLIIHQQEMRKELESIKQQTTNKETEMQGEMRQLQSSLGEMRNENDRLRDENDKLLNAVKTPSGDNRVTSNNKSSQKTKDNEASDKVT